ncbi:MAG: hypothetical protein AAF468_05125 [Pseudomonadota bacterium]
MAKAPQALAGGLKMAGQLLILTGILHCLSWIVGGWTSGTMAVIGFGVVYLVLGLALHFGIPKIRYLAFLVTLVGILAAYITLGSGTVPVWLSYIFIVIDLIVLLILFASIWRGRVVA